MKSILNNKCCEKKEKPFPKLMIGKSDNIFLFSRSGDGVCIHVPDPAGTPHMWLGWNSDNLGMGEFKDYEGSVCLSNE
jgi:hypothetical protein